MGEIIVSIIIGSCLVVSGIAMNVILGREEKRWSGEKTRGSSEKADTPKV